MHKVCKALYSKSLQFVLHSMWQLQTICLFTFCFGLWLIASVVIPLTTELIDRNRSPLTCQDSSLIQCFCLRPRRERWVGSFSQVHSRVLGCLEWYQPSSLYFEWLHGWKGEQPKIKGEKWIMNKIHKKNLKCILLPILSLSMQEYTIPTFYTTCKPPPQKWWFK